MIKVAGGSMRRELLTVVIGVAPGLLLIAPTLSAQDDIFVTPIPNAPFSAVINVERSIIRQDGTVLNLKTVRALHRDSRGHAQVRDSSRKAVRYRGLSG